MWVRPLDIFETLKSICRISANWNHYVDQLKIFRPNFVCSYYLATPHHLFHFAGQRSRSRSQGQKGRRGYNHLYRVPFSLFFDQFLLLWFRRFKAIKVISLFGPPCTYSDGLVVAEAASERRVDLSHVARLVHVYAAEVTVVADVGLAQIRSPTDSDVSVRSYVAVLCRIHMQRTLDMKDLRVCSSVCLSHAAILSKRLCVSSNFFSPSGSPAIVVFTFQTL